MMARVVRAAPLAALMSGLLTLGCAGTSWDDARRADTVVAYHQFLRDNPSSGRAGTARERIDYLRLKGHPSPRTFEEFERSYPESAFLAELEGLLEPLYFEQARADNSPGAYREFLNRYPGGSLAIRARGNEAYVQGIADRPDAASLRQFLWAYPDSDFALEARTTLELLELRQATRIETLAVRVDVAANVDHGDRVRRGFSAVVARAYQEKGIEVRLVPPGEQAPPDVDAWIHLVYKEVPASGTFGGSSLYSRCRVRLYHRDQEEPIWDRVFEAPAEHLTRRAPSRDKTLFGNARYSFWEEFFVPFSSWATSRLRVQRLEYSEPVVSIDAMGDRAAVLFLGGGIEYLDVSSPLEPKVIRRYWRSRDLTKWTGLLLVPRDRVLVFGTNGAELLGFGSGTVERLGRWEASEIGRIRSAALYGSTLLLAGAKGLHAVRYNNEELLAHPLIDAKLVGVEVQKPYVYLLGPAQLDVATPKQLLSHLTGRKIELGGRFDASKSRLTGGALYVFGGSSLVEFNLVDPANPVPVARLDPEELGPLSDLSAANGHLFLLGDRGLLVAGEGGKWVSDLIQVDGAKAMASKGRFALVAGKQSVDILDLSPYRSTGVTATD